MAEGNENQQVADLSKNRRARIFEADYRENLSVPTNTTLEANRRSNQTGTEEYREARRNQAQLSAWGNAFLTLQDDGTADDDLQEIGTGIGQSHRQRLHQDNSNFNEPRENHTHARANELRRSRPRSPPPLAIRVGGVSINEDPMKLAKEMRAEFTRAKGSKSKASTHSQGDLQHSIPITRKRVPKSAGTTSISPYVAAQTYVPESKMNKRRGKETEAAAAAESFNRQEWVGPLPRSFRSSHLPLTSRRTYGSGLNLSTPLQFLAVVAPNRFCQSSETARRSEAPQPAPRRTPSSAAATTSKTVKPTSTRARRAEAPPQTQSEGSFPPTIDGLAAAGGAQPAAAAVQQTAAPVQTTQGSLLDFLPTLRQVLPAAQFAQVQALLATQKLAAQPPQPVTAGSAPTEATPTTNAAIYAGAPALNESIRGTLTGQPSPSSSSQVVGAGQTSRTTIQVDLRDHIQNHAIPDQSVAPPTAGITVMQPARSIVQGGVTTPQPETSNTEAAAPDATGIINRAPATITNRVSSLAPALEKSNRTDADDLPRPGRVRIDTVAVHFGADSSPTAGTAFAGTLRNTPTVTPTTPFSPTSAITKVLPQALEYELKKCVQQTSLGNWKCLVPGCSKTFRSSDTWRRHVDNRHSEWRDELEGRTAAQLKLESTAGAIQGLTQTSNRTTISASQSSVVVQPTATQMQAHHPTQPIVHPTTEPTGATQATAEATTPRVRALALAHNPTRPFTQTTSQPAPTTTTHRGRQSLSEGLKRQREAIIGEHIYKHRYESFASSCENYPANENISVQSSEASTAAVAPQNKFHSNFVKISEPSAAPLATKSTNTEPMATGNPFGPPRASTRPAGPALPSFLQRATTSSDPGAAARAQYEAIEISRPLPSNENIRPSSSNNILTQSSRPTSRTTNHVSTTPHVVSSTGSGPALPTFLQGASPSTDLGAAVRQQYANANASAGIRTGQDPLESAKRRGI